MMQPLALALGFYAGSVLVGTDRKFVLAKFIDLNEGE
jgi:hypothetical protein